MLTVFSHVIQRNWQLSNLCRYYFFCRGSYHFWLFIINLCFFILMTWVHLSMLILLVSIPIRLHSEFNSALVSTQPTPTLVLNIKETSWVMLTIFTHVIWGNFYWYKRMHTVLFWPLVLPRLRILILNMLILLHHMLILKMGNFSFRLGGCLWSHYFVLIHQKLIELFCIISSLFFAFFLTLTTRFNN